MKKLYSNGKLLITGEYVVLDGVKALAVPTKFGQDLEIMPLQEPVLTWASFTHEGVCWFEASFNLKNMRLTHCSYASKEEGAGETIAETLLKILLEAQRLNPKFLTGGSGFLVKTTLGFPQNWGLGSSSTLLNNIASWAAVDAYELLWNAFSGSGYDIACAQHNHPIFYQLEAQKPVVTPVDFNPSFADELFFVHLNTKQNSREGIAQYQKHRKKLKEAPEDFQQIADLAEEFVKASSKKDFEKLMVAHEERMSSIIKLARIQETAFSDYFGAVKSLGAWGGDFVLATGNEDTPRYFKQKGFETVVRYKDMIL